MLTIYRRHTRACTARRPQHDRAFRKCRCPLYAEGKIGNASIRESLKTRDWEIASRRVMEAEARGAWEPAGKTGIPVADAIAAFLEDAASETGRKLAPATLSKYRTLFGRLSEFCHGNCIESLQLLTADRLRQFKAAWRTGPRASNNNLTRLRAWLQFCLANEWISKNPALALRPVQHIRDTQKLPFSNEEMDRILAAAEPQAELSALLLVLRYTGLRISDAAMLRADRLEGGELRLHTQKTGSWVALPLAPAVLARLASIEVKPGGYWFVTGSPRMETVADLWRRRIQAVFRAAGIANGTVHRFRHTFAVDLLTKGVDIKTVSLLLGHSSVTITERFYAAWIPGRQRKLSDELRGTWKDAA